MLRRICIFEARRAQVGDSVVMLADETPQAKSPETLGGTAGSLLLYLENVDAVVEKAVRSGAKLFKQD